MGSKSALRKKRARSSAKAKSDSGGPIAANVELITENVFVPVTRAVKTAATKASAARNRGPTASDASKRKVELVEAGQARPGAPGSLLGRRFRLPAKRSGSATSYPKQEKQESRSREKETPSRSAARRSRTEKKPELLFPSSISDLPSSLPFPSSRDPTKSTEESENGRRDDGRVESSEDGEGGCREERSRRRLAEKNVCREAIPSKPGKRGSGVAARKSIGEQWPAVPYPDAGSSTVDAPVKGAASGGVLDQGEEIRFPVDRVRSNGSAFDLPTVDRFFARDEWSGGAPSRWEDVDRSILSLLTSTRPRYRSDEESREDGRQPGRGGIRYSWQVIGTSAQTSQTLFDSFLEDEIVRECSVKYSWQIIGIATQTSKSDSNVSQCRSVASFLGAKAGGLSARRDPKASTEAPAKTTLRRNGKRFIVLNNQWTQTFAHKDSQTVFTELYGN